MEGIVMTIGGVSAATGVPPETLRTWERRYGFPSPERGAGGHRVYSAGTVARLRQVVRVIDLGYRPGAVLQMDAYALEEVLRGALAMGERERAADRDAPPAPELLAALWIEYAGGYDVGALERSFERAWYTHGVRVFVESYASAFERELNRRERSGEVSEGLARFARAQLRDYMTGHLRGLVKRSSGPVVVCAPLPGAGASTQLYGAAVLIALAGCRAVVLGEALGVDEILDAVCEVEPSASALYLSAALESDEGVAALRSLRDLCVTGCEVLCGGEAAPRVDGVIRMGELSDVAFWSPSLFLRHGRS